MLSKIHDCLKSVCDGDYGAAWENFLQCIHHNIFRLWVQATNCMASAYFPSQIILQVETIERTCW